MTVWKPDHGRCGRDTNVDTRTPSLLGESDSGEERGRGGRRLWQRPKSAPRRMPPGLYRGGGEGASKPRRSMPPGLAGRPRRAPPGGLAAGLAAQRVGTGRRAPPGLMAAMTTGHEDSGEDGVESELESEPESSYYGKIRGQEQLSDAESDSQ